MLVVVGQNAVLQPAARVSRRWREFQKVQGLLIDLRRVELVVDEGRGQRARHAAVAGRRSEGREITRAHRRRRRETDGRARVRFLYLALIAAEEKQLVLSDGAAHRAAELVALQTVALRGEEVRVEFVIARPIEHRRWLFVVVTMLTAGRMMAVARGQGAGLGLAARRRGTASAIQVIERVVMRAAVHHARPAVRQSARDRDGDGRIVFIRIQIRRRAAVDKKGKSIRSPRAR